MGKNKNKGGKRPQKGVGNNTMKNAIDKAVAVDQSKIIHGKVKWFDVKKGYGFLIDEDGNEYFCHHTGIVSGKTYTGLESADTVTFKVIPAEKGPQAVEINRVVEDSNEKSGSENAESVSEEVEEVSDESSGSGDGSGTETSVDTESDS